MKTAILARHAESEFSVRGAMNGDPGLAGALTEEGVGQATLLGEALRDDPIDLCVTTEFERTKQTADLALEGRDVPRLVVPELNDIRVGDFEGGLWRRTAPGRATGLRSRSRRAAGRAARRPPSGTRAASARCSRGRRSRSSSWRTASDPLLLLAIEGSEPRPVVASVDYATPYPLSRVDLEHALERIELWVRDPIWK